MMTVESKECGLASDFLHGVSEPLPTGLACAD